MNRQSAIPAALRRNDLAALRAILTAPEGLDLLAPVDLPSESITLRAHDSINLTTGVVTRSDVALEFATVNSNVAIRIRNRNLQSLRANDLGHLLLMIQDDGSIPQAPGECFWTPEACRANRQVHGPCLDHQVGSGTDDPEDAAWEAEWL